jgi:hypothetical protein
MPLELFWNLISLVLLQNHTYKLGNQLIRHKPQSTRDRYKRVRLSLLEHLHSAIIPFPLPLMALHASNRKARKLLEQLFRVG